MKVGRIIGSILLSSTMIFFVIVMVVLIVVMTTTDAGSWVFFAHPRPCSASAPTREPRRESLRYSIAATPDGVRVGLRAAVDDQRDAAARPHPRDAGQPASAVAPGGLVEMQVNVASQSAAQGAAAQQKSTILPVGNRDDVLKVLDLVLPGLVTDEPAAHRGRTREGTGGDGFTTTPRRGAVLRWFSWRRNGFALHRDAVLLRTGAIWR